MALRSNQAAERAQRELARTHRLPLLIEHTQQGFWQTDAAGRPRM